MPLASLIETGNHIAQAKSQRFELATQLMDMLKLAKDAQSPWAAFSNLLCKKESLETLIQEWPPLAAQELAIIKHVTEYYAQMRFEVEILTGDAGLKAYQPTTQPLTPRRKK